MAEYCCRTTDITPLNEQIHRIRFMPEDKALFEFKGGQYIILHMPDGKRIPLSIASAPEETNFIELHIRVVEGHPLAQDMLELFKTADSFQLEGAFGGCSLNDSTRDLVIIAGGTGFSPMKSMIESAFSSQSNRNIELYLGAQVINDLYQHDMINDWQTNNSHFKYVPVISGGDKNWNGATGFPHEAAMERDEKELVEKDFYISGSEVMVVAVYNSLKDKGVDKSQIHSDILNIKREKGEIE